MRSYHEFRRLGYQMEAFMTDNARYQHEFAHRLVGIRHQVDRVVTLANSDAEPSYTARKDPISNILPPNRHDDDAVVPNINVRVLRRRSCHSACSCSCHRTQRLVSPGTLERLVGSLFMGYTGIPSPFRRCDVYDCRQRSLTHVKLTYRFPAWFWNRAIHVAFLGGGPSPELVLRFPCVRPFESDWGTFVRAGAVEDLKYLIDRKQASLHDVDSKYGMTALHWSMHRCRVDMVSFLIHSGADWAAEDGFGLTPRHCLLFDYQYFLPCGPTRDNRLLLLQQYSSLDNSSKSDLLEEPALHRIYRGEDTHDALRASLRSRRDIDAADALGHTLLTKAIGWTDEPTGERISGGTKASIS